MKTYTRGNYLGSPMERINFGNITASKTVYFQQVAKDWHCHENPIFAYFLKGGNKEFRNSKAIHCTAGTMLFYNAGEIHRNTDYEPGSRIFHLEIDQSWFSETLLPHSQNCMPAIDHPEAKHTFINIIREFSLRDDLSASSIQSLVIYLWNILARLSNDKVVMPHWKAKFESLIADASLTKHTLASVSSRLGMHPVTLSKEFPKYFHCSFGEYMRQRRLEKSLVFLAKKSMPIVDIAEACGFSDAANFIRSFKRSKSITPDAYRRML